MLIHGMDIPMKAKKDEFKMIDYLTCRLNNALKIPMEYALTLFDIVTCQELPQRNRRIRKPPVVVVKFVQRCIRNRIFRNKALLVQSRISVTEHLCVERMKLLAEARKAFGFKEVWSDQGLIFVTGVDGYKHCVRSTIPKLRTT